MADPSACCDWYFGPVFNDFNFENKSKSHEARSLKYGGEAKLFFFLKKHCYYCRGMSRDIVI